MPRPKGFSKEDAAANPPTCKAETSVECNGVTLTDSRLTKEEDKLRNIKGELARTTIWLRNRPRTTDPKRTPQTMILSSNVSNGGVAKQERSKIKP